MTSQHRIAPAAPVARTVLTPLDTTSVTIDGGFWAHQQSMNRDSFIPHCDSSLERVGWVENFRAAVRGTLETDRVGRLFTDSEIYKTMEAMAWEIVREESTELRARLAELVDLVASAQADDGYLNTFYGYDGGPDRYTDFEWGHELYCAGHALQAVVAVERALGAFDPTAMRFTEVGRRLADHICREFGEGGREAICGHPEIETALVELYRSTGEERYLEQARLFVERRGHQSLRDTMYGGRDYYQDNVPVRDAEVLVGHSVRALYLATGALDVAVETGDRELLAAVGRQYDRTLERRTYLTGGMGSNHHGEAYGEDFELPSDRAYAETCAAIASIHLAWRLLLATGEEWYADIIERTLYNSVISSPSLDGLTFFYVNTLHRRSPGVEPEPGQSLRRTDGTRASWYTTSCCPTNFARTIASLGGYVATVDGEGVQLHQFVHGTVDVVFGEERRARLAVETGYPFDGTVSIRVVETDDAEWTLSVRIPGWADDVAVITPDGADVHGPGRASFTRVWRAGDVVRLELPMEARIVTADPRIDDVRGSVAVERGPLVYAIESVDQPDLDLDRVRWSGADALSVQPGSGVLDGIPTLTTTAAVIDEPESAWPYRIAAGSETGDRSVPLTLIPYYAWANRGSSSMRVWIPAVR
ncbi:glycoside hydrolase family 127 protein [Agromyces atrinae]|uniref:Glycoside hydrolase family 127 protein n=1 Tax=Agromyces atrinae TaxID=592376 RepID=A0A4Q2M916_9MICO|nr:beta-L-arabinofuranosidase domain-containing protein [Agromyces atrinae]NYD67286.1 hypothetical protein [Agromyces atrinae]RXZ86883.1 glycoside hydrolase family 127 protein [Agromyces atrinae]